MELKHFIKNTIRECLTESKNNKYDIEIDFEDNSVGSYYTLKSKYGSVSGFISNFSIEPKSLKLFNYKTISVSSLQAKEIGKGYGYMLLIQLLEYARKNNITVIESSSLNEFSTKTFEKIERDGLIHPFYVGMNDKTMAWFISND